MHLVLNTYGTYLSVENGQFAILHKDGKQVVAPDKIKTISVSKGALITSDAALMAIENGIDVFFVNSVGKPVGRIWSVKFGSITTIRRNQIDFSLSKQAVEWIKDIIIEKLNNQIALLLTFDIEDIAIKRQFDRIINRISDYKTKVKNITGEIVPDVAKSLRGWEGAASKNYFSAINLILPEEYKFQMRTQRPAKDLFNALLNYGYGMLYAKIEGALIKAGIDPYVGIMHREDYNRPVLVFDVIEKYRVWIDYVVVNLLVNRAVTDEMCSIDENGSFWLEAMAKRILIQSVNDYFEEVISVGNLQRSRDEQIKLFCQKLASKFAFFNG